MEKGNPSSSANWRTSARQGKRVVVFGIFDGIHDGHRDFFRQAKEYGDELVAIVGRDEICMQLKNKKPRYSENERVELVAKEELVDKAVLGDSKLSTYSVLVQLQPDVICLGYDQDKLQEDLKNWFKTNDKKFAVHRLKPYKPEKFHSSLL
ncbi:MAG: adenylyltransferase/cytidyltransferase family protein [Patescibacteria group bacterium]